MILWCARGGGEYIFNFNNLLRWVKKLDDRFHEIDHGTDNLLADSSFVVDQRGAVSWQDGGERSSWRLPARRLKHWWLFRGRGPSRRAGYRGRRCCSRIASTRRFSRSGKNLVCIIRRSSAASSGRWRTARWQHSTTGRDRARRR